MIRKLLRTAALLGAFGLGACDLAVDNPNQPNTKKVLATPADLESLLGSYYRRWHDGVYRGTGNIEGIANVQSFQNYSSLANNCQNARAGIPRATNDNSLGATCGGDQQRIYAVEQEVVRVASTILTQLNDPDFTLGSPAQNLRAKAFGELLRGLSLGYLALVYDSAAIISVGQSTEDPGTLSFYPVVMDSAIVALDNALVHSAASAAEANQAGGFPLPASWIPSSTTFNRAEFDRVVRSYRARFRANVARTPTERAAVNWTLVIADAQNGFTADHNNITSTTTGPFRSWVSQYHSFGLWHQMTPFIMGMGDGGTDYQAWLQQPVDQRGTAGAFFMVTPDLRFPQGANRTAQQNDFAVTSCTAASTVCPRYFRNRPSGNDQFAGLGWGWSNYDFARFYSWSTSGDGTSQNGRLVNFAVAELRMLEAEGQIRAGNLAAAVTLINATRTPNNLTPVTVAGVVVAANCVPKVPVGPNFNTVACGGGGTPANQLMEAMKWEKRIETYQTSIATWYFDGRGWGDLAEGTPLHFAVPYQDLQARGKAVTELYSIGVGTTGAACGGRPVGCAAPKGTYGF